LIAAQVTSDTTIHIVLTLLLMASWYGELLDFKGAMEKSKNPTLRIIEKLPGQKMHRLDFSFIEN
jgi:hypothetical protein